MQVSKQDCFIWSEIQLGVATESAAIPRSARCFERTGYVNLFILYLIVHAISSYYQSTFRPELFTACEL